MKKKNFLSYFLFPVLAITLLLSLDYGCTRKKPPPKTVKEPPLQIPVVDEEGPLAVSIVKPTGADQTDIGQIVIVFNKRMVPLGDMEKSAQNLPIHVEPEPDCHWRWLNTTTLACWLDEELPLSSAYGVTVEAGITAMDGSTLKETHSSWFSTATLKKAKSHVEFTGPVNPLLTIAFNQAVKMSSLQQKAKLTCNGHSGSFKLQIRPLTTDEEVGDWETSRTYRIESDTDLPSDSTCQFIFPKGLESEEGPLPSVSAITAAFKTYPEFYVAELGCGWKNKTHGKGKESSLELQQKCDPDSNAYISFSVPTKNKFFAGKFKISPYGGWQPGGYNSPEYMRDNPEEQLSRYYLNSPFEGMTTYEMELDPSLKDRFGRPIQGAKKFRFTTTHFKPSLQIPDSFGVIEKNGPHKLAYKAVNVKDFKLRLFSTRAVEDFDYIKLQNSYQTRCKENLLDPRKKYKSQVISTGGKWDEALTLPMDFDQLVSPNPFGLILGLVDQAHDMNGKAIDRSGRFNTDPPCPRSFQVLITDLGITAKLGYFNGGVWVHSLQTGLPVPGTRLTLIDPAGKPVHQGLTDEQGFLEFPGLKRIDPGRTMTGWRNSGNWYIIAKTENDFSMLNPRKWSQGISPYDFGLANKELTRKTNFMMQTITDRPLYKPGDSVRIKIFARQWDHESLKLLDPEESKLKVHVSNYNDEKVLESTEVELNNFSTATVSFKLPANAATGKYTIYVTNSLGYALSKQDAFQVEEYRLPPFKVTLSSPKSSYGIREMVPIKGKVEYHFGGGVGRAAGKLHASFMSLPFKPAAPRLASFAFGDSSSKINWWEAQTQGARPAVFLETKTKTNTQGFIDEVLTLPAKTISSHGTVTVEAGFQDDAGKNIANRISFNVHPTEFYLGVKTKEWSYAPNEDFKTQVLAVAPDETTLTGKEVSLTLLKRTFNTVRRRGAGNYFHYETTTEDKAVETCSFITSDKPKGCPLKAKSAGYYVIQAEASDRNGRKVSSSMARYVTGPEYIGWWRYDHDRIDLIADKPEYQAGDRLRVLVKSPYEKARALITLERHGILHREEREIIGGGQILEFPLDNPSYVPGMYLSVVLINGRSSEKLEGGVDIGRPSFKMGLIKITVKSSNTQLSIKTTSDRPEYEPGDTISGSIQVANSKGKGTESEVAIAVVDEALLQLVGHYQKKYEIHDGFYTVPPIDMETAETLTYLIGRRHFGKKGAAAGGGGGVAMAKLREVFKAVAYWEPSLTTDKNGKAEFSFTAPDNLTGWRIIAVAVDQNHRFGTGGSSFKVNKDLIIESGLPNFITEGDEFNARFVIHNRTESGMKAKVEIEPKGLEVQGESQARVTLEKSGKAVVDFPLKAKRTDSAEVVIHAKGGKSQDGMRLQLPVSKFLSLETFATYGSTTGREIGETVEIPDGIRTDVGSLELLLNSSVLSNLDETFEYVFRYPYACWEQQITKALMLHNGIKLDGYLSESQRLEENSAKAEIRRTLEKAALFQAPNGGFAFWKPVNKYTSPYLSAYTGLVFHRLHQAGYTVPEKVEKNLNEYLRKLLFSEQHWHRWHTKRSKATVRAMVANLLAYRGEKIEGPINTLYGERELLSLFGKGFLLMALDRQGESKNTQKNSLKTEIMNRSEMTSGKIQFRESVDDGFSRILHSPTRTNCLLLTAIAQTDPGSKQLSPLLRFISTSRKANRWNNTQENIYCLNAMVDYAKIYERDQPNFKATGYFGEEKMGEAVFDRMESQPTVLKHSFEPTDPGTTHPLVIKKDGTGRVYYTARIRFAYEKVRLDPVNSGMSVNRKYFILQDKEWVPVTGNVLLKRGDLVRVQLTVGIPSERLFVALNDPLPAGLEPLNTALATASLADASLGESDNSSGSYFWNEDDYWYGAYQSGGFYHREIRLQSVQYFADFIPPGQYELNYVAQAIATGKFMANPTLIEEMYDPEVYGKGVPAQFIIGEK